MIVFKVFYQDFYQIYLIVTATFIMFWNQTFTWVLFMGDGACGVFFFLFSQETQHQNIARIVILCYVIINN